MLIKQYSGYPITTFGYDKTTEISFWGISEQIK